jgi:hypothetical protein
MSVNRPERAERPEVTLAKSVNVMGTHAFANPWTTKELVDAVFALASGLEEAQKALIRCAELSGVDGEAVEAAASGALMHPPLLQWATEGVAELREAYDEALADVENLAQLGLHEWERAGIAEEALREIENVLPESCADNKCEGCRVEIGEARSIARGVLTSAGTRAEKDAA